jgi:hypothetical protein
METNNDEMQYAKDLLNTAVWEAEARMRAIGAPTDENRRAALVSQRSLVMAERRFQGAVEALALIRSSRGDPIEPPPERLVHEDTPAL